MTELCNHEHYNLEKQPKSIQKIAAEHKLPWPCFIGQGLSKSVGTDCYGYYIVAKKQIGKKVIWGIAEAGAKFGPEGWTSGYQYCSIDIDKAQPSKWIMSSGKYHDGSPKWWFCDENGHKFNGHKARFGWNGAHAYQDPSF